METETDRGALASFARVLDMLMIVALLGAATASVAGFAGRASWMFDLASHFRVQYVAALLIATGWMIWIRRWLIAVIGFGFSLVNLFLIAPLYLSGPAADQMTVPNESHWRLLSANVLFGNDQFDVVLTLIDREAPDVIVIMELSAAWEEALRELKSRYPHQIIEPSESNFGIAVYSRMPLSETEVFSGPTLTTKSIVTKLSVGSRKVTMIATHAVPPTSRKLSRARDLHLDDIAERAAGFTGPVMVVGDFNTSSWSPTFRRFVRISDLVDSRKGFGVQATWPAHPRWMSIPIDHCLVSEGLRVVDRRVGPDIGSDHRPILIDFER